MASVIYNLDYKKQRMNFLTAGDKNNFTPYNVRNKKHVRKRKIEKRTLFVFI